MSVWRMRIDHIFRKHHQTETHYRHDIVRRYAQHEQRYEMRKQTA